jgi:hypothetical protein
MAVAFDAFSEVAAGTGTLSWTHTPSAAPQGVIVFVVENGTTSDGVTTVTYGGVGLTEVSGSPNILSSGETGVVHCFFLGSSVPNSGAQTVTVNISGSVTRRAAAITLTGSVDLEVVDSDGTINSTATSNPSITLSTSGRTSFGAIAFQSGRPSIGNIIPLANWTDRLEHDFGAQVAGWYTFDTIGSSDITAGWTQGNDDAVAVAIAVTEGSPQGNGSLDAQGATVTGSGISKSDGNEALLAQDVTVDGSGQVSWSGNGALAAQSAEVDGSAQVHYTGDGSLAAQGPIIDGSGVSKSDGNGALTAQDAQVDGSGDSKSTGNGALAAQLATVAGSGISKSDGNGALAAQSVTVSGSGSAVSPATGVKYNFFANKATRGSQSGVKPDYWDLTPQRVNSEWRWFWNHAILASDLRAAPRDLVVRGNGGELVGTARSVTGPLGQAIDTSQATADRIRFPAGTTEYELAGDIEFTIIVVGQVFSLDGSAPGIIAYRSSGANGFWELYSGSVNDDIRFSYRITAGTQTLNFGNNSSPFVGSSPGVGILTRERGGTFRFFKNGAELSSQVDTDTPVSGSHRVVVGVLGEDATTHAQNGHWYAVSVLKHIAITSSQARDITRDPFGPFRQKPKPLFVPVGSAAGAPSGNGSLDAQAATLSGSGVSSSVGNGILTTTDSQVAGSGISKSSGNGKLGEVVVDENWPSAGSNFFLFGATGGNEQAAINFTAKLTTTTTTVRFFLSTVGGTPSDDVIVDIAADSAGAPGSVLDTVTLANAGFGGAGVYELPLVASLTASTSYWLVFRRSGGPQASPWWSFKWQQVAGDPDPDAGTYWFNGSVWTEDTAGDGYFFIGGLQQATVAGSGEVKYTGDGSLDAQSASISGSGVSKSLGNGALQAQDSEVSGSGSVASAAIQGNGILDVQDAQAAGSGVSLSDGNGSLDAQDSQIAGSGDSKSLGNGNLQAQDSEVAGSGIIEAVTGNGDLQAQTSEASGSGISKSSGNGALAVQAVQVAGSGTSASVGNGSLDAQSSTVDGSGAIAAVTGNGDLQAQAAQIDGSGVSSSTGADILVAQNSTVSGSGVSSSSGNGVLSAQSAQVDGSGTLIALGNGSLLVQQAQVDGSGAVRTLGNGNLSAQDGTVDGSGASSSAGNGALQAQDSQVDGSGDAGLSIINGNGSLLAQIATVTASGTSGSTGNGALQAQDAEMFGTDGIFVAAQSDFQGFRYGRKPQVKSAKLTFN